MVKFVRLILSVIVGCVVSFIIAMYFSGIHAILTCGIFALAITLLVSAFISQVCSQKGIILLANIIIFIVAFVLYAALYTTVDEAGDMNLGSFLVIFAPYIVATYILCISYDNNENNNGS